MKTTLISDQLFSIEYETLSIVVVRGAINHIALFIVCMYIPSNSSINVYLSVSNALNIFFSNLNIEINDIILIFGNFKTPKYSWIPHGDESNGLVPVVTW